MKLGYGCKAVNSQCIGPRGPELVNVLRISLLPILAPKRGGETGLKPLIAGRWLGCRPHVEHGRKSTSR